MKDKSFQPTQAENSQIISTPEKNVSVHVPDVFESMKMFDPKVSQKELNKAIDMTAKGIFDMINKITDDYKKNHNL